MDKQQEQKNKEQLAKFLQIFGADKIVTPDDIKSVLKGVLEIMNSFKKGNETLNKETTSIVESLLNKVMVEHEKMKTEVARETSDTKEEINEKVEKSIQEMKKMCEDLILRKPQDGMDGKDADEEEIVIKVLEQIKLPENKVLTGEDIVDSINALSLDPENLIDASHIKNLPKATEVKGGGVRLLQYLADVNISNPTNNQVLKYNSTTYKWENGSGGAGTVDGSGTTDELAYWVDSDTLGALAVATYPSKTEISYVKGVTSAIQTQLNAKQPLDTQLTSLAGLSYTGNGGKFIRVNAGETDFELATISGTGTVTSVAMSVPTGLTVTGSPITTTGTLAIALDTGYVIPLQTTLDGFVTEDQTVGQTIGDTTNRLTKLWATDITVTNAIAGSVTGNAGTVTNATLTTALTVNTGTVTLTGNVANTSVLTIGAGAVSVSGTNTGDQTSVSGNAGTATALQTARTIGGVSFDGTANITVATATGGFTVSGGDLAIGTNSLTLTGSIGATAARATKVWTTDLESTNMPTVGGTAILTSLTAPQFTTIELGHATDTTLSRVSAGVAAIEGSQITTLNTTSYSGNQTQTLAVKTRYLLSVGLYETQNLTLPATYAVGDEIEFIINSTSNAGTVNIILASSDNFLYVGSDGQTTSTTSDFVWTRNGSFKLVCTVANTTWEVVDVCGSGGSFGGTYISAIGYSIPISAGSIMFADYAQTVTNKRNQPRQSSGANGNITPDLTNFNFYIRTALSATCTIGVPTGTPVNGEELLFRFKDNGTARTLSWNAIYRAMGTTIPTTTVISKTLYVRAIYNSTDTKWDVVQVNQEA